MSPKEIITMKTKKRERRKEEKKKKEEKETNIIKKKEKQLKNASIELYRRLYIYVKTIMVQQPVKTVSKYLK